MEKVLNKVKMEAKLGYDDETGWVKNGKWGGVDCYGNFSPNNAYMGVHQCICGAKSHSRDYLLPNGYVTNSLAVHYLEFHRDEVSDVELAKIDQMLK